MFETTTRATWARALCFAALAITGCARQASSPPPSTDTPPALDLRVDDRDLLRAPRTVSAAEALADLDVAVRIFDQAYVGTDQAPRTPDPAQIEAARATLAQRPAWDPTALADAMRSLFRTPDGHLSFGYEGDEPLHLYAWPPPSGTLPPPPPSDAAVSFTDGPVPVLAIRTFESAAKTALDRLPAIARHLRNAPAFVVDLRGNGGGNYTFAESFILELTSQRLRRLDEREVRSAAAAEGRANSARRRLRQGDVPPEALPLFEAHIARLEADARAFLQTGAKRREIVVQGATVQGRAPTPLRARAVFLVDRGCASACEMMIALARQIPSIIVVGEATRGGMAAAELAFFRLPHSGVTISLGTRAYHDPQGDFEELRGFLPEITLTGDDPLAEALAIAKNPAPPSRTAALR